MPSVMASTAIPPNGFFNRALSALKGHLLHKPHMLQPRFPHREDHTSEPVSELHTCPCGTSTIFGVSSCRPCPASYRPIWTQSQQHTSFSGSLLSGSLLTSLGCCHFFYLECSLSSASKWLLRCYTAGVFHLPRLDCVPINIYISKSQNIAP